MKAILLVVTAGLAACASESSTSQVSSLVIVSGNHQSGVVGTELPAPLVVQVVDGASHPVPGAIVNFRVTAGGGSVFAGAALTNASGIAQERWTLGTSITGAQTVDVRAVDATTGAEISYGTFSATATRGSRKQLVAVTPNPTDGIAGAILSPAPQVRLADQFGNPVKLAGIAVNFAVTGGGGSLATSSVMTDSQGIATLSSWQLGPGTAAYASNTVVASSPFMTPLTLVANGHQQPSTLAIYSGDHQQVKSGVPGATPPVVRVTDQFGNPVAGYSVMFQAVGGGSVGSSGATSVVVPTGNDGLATTAYVPPANQHGSLVASAGATTPGQVTFDIVPSDLSWTPDSHDFGSVSLTLSASYGFLLTNNTDVPMSTSGGYIYGGFGQPSSFGIDGASTCTGTLAAGASCTLLVDFVPESYRLGQPVKASPRINYNYELGPGMLELAIATTTVTGYAIPFVTTDQGDHDFGPVPVSQTASTTFSVTNDSPETLDLSLDAGMAPFYLGANTGCFTSSLAPGASCTFDVEFRPDAVGFTSNNVVIDFRSGGNLVYQTGIPVYGTGTSVVAFDQASFDFGQSAFGASTPSHRFTATNVGTLTVHETGVAFTGNNPGDFWVASDTCTGATLPPGGTCTVDLYMNTIELGAVSATFAATFSDAGSPATSTDATVDLSGYGT